mmetsp:Transcript_400/g.1352  ORF Transcript_400/g.1352 Transcript_400/m.1352 type:complete len:215 (-) Transcript_400:1332-1976(-)
MASARASHAPSSTKRSTISCSAGTRMLVLALPSSSKKALYTDLSMLSPCLLLASRPDGSLPEKGREYAVMKDEKPISRKARLSGAQVMAPAMARASSRRGVRSETADSTFCRSKVATRECNSAARTMLIKSESQSSKAPAASESISGMTLPTNSIIHPQTRCKEDRLWLLATTKVSAIARRVIEPNCSGVSLRMNPSFLAQHKELVLQTNILRS